MRLKIYFVLFTLALLLGCQKDMLMITDKPELPDIVQKAQVWVKQYGKNSTSLDTRNLKYDWESYKLGKNSQQQTVLFVPVLKKHTETNYSELSFLITPEGQEAGIIKVFKGNLTANYVPLDMYAISGELLHSGTYDTKHKTFSKKPTLNSSAINKLASTSSSSGRQLILKVKQECPDGLHFNPVISACDFPENIISDWSSPYFWSCLYQYADGSLDIEYEPYGNEIEEVVVTPPGTPPGTGDPSFPPPGGGGSPPGGGGGYIPVYPGGDDDDEEESVTVTVSSTIVEVLDPYTITVTASSNQNPVTEVTYQMSRSGESNWKTIHEEDVSGGTTFNYQRMAWTPGVWKVKAIVRFQNGTVKEAVANSTVEEQFPHIDKFKDNTALTSHLSGTLWDMTVNYAQASQDAHAIREYGCFIHLKRDGTYYAGATIEGPVVYLDGQGSVMAYVPFSYSDNPLDPRNKDDLIVGTMHTHYPLTWAAPNNRRTIGASGPDNNADLPGIGYDYVSNITTGHNVNATKDFFTHGRYERRPTTQ